MGDTSDKGSNLLYFVVGGAVGAIIALLFAPRSGKETREFIANKALEGKEFLSTAARNMQEKATDVVDQTKETLSQKKTQVSAAIEAGKQAYRDEKAKTN
jgi:gas vesicle protein